ncbi:MAG: hypothetical protein CME70_18815 [Halobacteriovorax sp.]|nr:hypothetical protein [Halobacteriovorax sp.]|tara:strand:+ start:134 stop:589 length:456 start_codon:yes stop_codon:yes gene_type:complete
MSDNNDIRWAAMENDIKDLQKELANLKDSSTSSIQKLREDSTSAINDVLSHVLLSNQKLETLHDMLVEMKEGQKEASMMAQDLDKRVTNLEHDTGQKPDRLEIERLFSAREPRLVLMEDKLASQKKLTWLVLAALLGTLVKMGLDVLVAVN